MINTLFTVSAASAAETEAAGARLARTLIPALEKDGFALVALSGELGAGKTAFTRGLVSVFSEDAYVHSPSYTIVNEYKGFLPSGRKLTVAHFDVWRLKTEDDLYSVGYFDWFPYGGTASGAAVLMAVEWCGSVPGAMPDECWRADIEGSGESVRRITVSRVEGGK